MACARPVLAAQESQPPIPSPVVIDKGWSPGDVFTLDDDPDRMNIPWNPPKFLLPERGGMGNIDPVEALRIRAGRTTCAEELDLPWSFSTGSSFAKVVHNVLSPEECSQLVEAANSKGYTPALLNIGGGSQVYLPRGRSSSRCVVDSPCMAAYLLSVLRPHLPKKMQLPRLDADGETCNHVLHEVNERCRFLCYQPGQEFSAHYDGCYSVPAGPSSPASRSALTLQIYLHDVDPKHGGATTFIDQSTHQWHEVQPRCGSVLIFTQNLFHEGSKLLSGVKHTVRTDVMYTPHPDRGSQDLAERTLCEQMSEAELGPATPIAADGR